MSAPTNEDGTPSATSTEIALVPPVLSPFNTEITLVPSGGPPLSDEPVNDVLASLYNAFQNGVMLISQGSHVEGVQQFAQVLEAVERFISDASSRQGQTSSDASKPLPGIEEASTLAHVVSAYYTYASGLLAYQSGDFFNACARLTEAARLFREQSDGAVEVKMIACMATVLAMQAEAQALIRQGKKSAAEQKNNDIITFIFSDVMPHSREIDPSMAGSFLILLTMSYIFRSSGAMVSGIVGADYDSVLSHAAEIGIRIDALRNAAAEIELAEQIRGNLEKIILVLTLHTNGLEAMAFAGNAAKAGDWAGFDHQIGTAKARLRDAQRICLEVKELAPRAEAIESMIQMLVEPISRHVSEQRRLYEQIDEWKQWYRDLAGKAGVTVNSTPTAETVVINELKNTVEVSTNIANYFHDRATEQLLGLRATLLTIPGDNVERDELLKKLNTVLALPKGDSSWLSSIKTFTGDAAKIVGSLAKIASPVATAWNLLAPLFGMPPLPLPVK